MKKKQGITVIGSNQIQSNPWMDPIHVQLWCTLLWPVVINKTIIQQKLNRCTEMEVCWNINKDAQTSQVVSDCR